MERGISIHALREEGDAVSRMPSPYRRISIHALREEGDTKRLENHSPRTEFLSTPSARRATGLHRGKGVLLDISIHALREEGDLHHEPCKVHHEISIHALREEGD